MPSCLSHNKKGASGVLERLNEEQGGAVFLLCLVGILILLLMSWVLVDGILVTRDKSEVQSSADAGAYSGASVKARSMNMMAFSNVAKRSLVGVHATYEAMVNSYAMYVEELFWERCDFDSVPPDTWYTCEDSVFVENRDLYEEEMDGDYEAYQDNRDFYMADLRGLDNYQQYLTEITGWWAWSESVLRAQRNGATLASSFRPPAADGMPRGGYQSMVQPVINEAGGGMAEFQNPDRLPVEKGAFWATMVEDGMERAVFDDWEHVMNADHHRQRSELGAAENSVIHRGASSLFEGALEQTYQDLGEHGRPWRIWSRADQEARWYFDSSHIVLTYHHHPGLFTSMREGKYDGVFGDYERSGELRDSDLYRPTGYWGMARAEFSYQHEEAPDLWRPVWTARMRPMALPDEFRQRGWSFQSIYHSSIDFLALSARIHDELRGEEQEFMHDLVYMERAARAMGQSTIDGVAR